MKNWFTYFLRLLVLLVLTCNAGGVFATTISSNTTLSSATSYSGDVTVNPGVTLTITSEVTITGNLTNNGGTIIVGEGGVLTVNGNVTNTSLNGVSPSIVVSTTYSDNYDRDATKNAKRSKTTISINYRLGQVTVKDGGKMHIVGDIENNAALISIETSTTEQISSISVNGTLTNQSSHFSGTRTTNVEAQKASKSGSTYIWVDDNNNSSNTTTAIDIVSSINISNGYLLVDGNLELQDNSNITFAGSGIGEDVESTIRVRSISGTEGNVTQSENAVITLASGAKGKMIVAGAYTDNTTTDDNHPWEITDEGTLVTESGFNLYVQRYVSARLNGEIDEINEHLADLNEQLAAIDGKPLDEYLRTLYPDEWNTYQYGSYTSWWTTHYYRDDYSTFSAYLYSQKSLLERALWTVFGNGLSGYEAGMTAEQNEAIQELKDIINENVALKEAFETLQDALENEGVQASEIATQSSSVSTILPIELTSFIVSATEYGYTFNWVTASEVENDYFTLEFSENGEEFIAIDYIHGAGTTSQTSEYEYRWDAKPTADILYFRLKQTDYNGEFTYSDILVYAPKKTHGATRTLYYGPLKLNVVDGQLQYIVE